jgi:hypothetical protein
VVDVVICKTDFGLQLPLLHFSESGGGADMFVDELFLGFFALLHILLMRLFLCILRLGGLDLIQRLNGLNQFSYQFLTLCRSLSLFFGTSAHNKIYNKADTKKSQLSKKTQ